MLIKREWFLSHLVYDGVETGEELDSQTNHIPNPNPFSKTSNISVCC